MAAVSDPSVAQVDVFTSGINAPVTVRVTLADGRVATATDRYSARAAREEAIRLALDTPAPSQ